MHLMHLLIGSYSCILTPPPHCPAVMHLTPTPLRVYIYIIIQYITDETAINTLCKAETHTIQCFNSCHASQPASQLFACNIKKLEGCSCMHEPASRQLLGYNNIAIMPFPITSFSMLPPSLPSPTPHHPIPTLKAYSCTYS